MWFLGPTPGSMGSVGLGCGSWICISNTFLDNANAAGSENMFDIAGTPQLGQWGQEWLGKLVGDTIHWEERTKEERCYILFRTWEVWSPSGHPGGGIEGSCLWKSGAQWTGVGFQHHIDGKWHGCK